MDEEGPISLSQQDMEMPITHEDEIGPDDPFMHTEKTIKDLRRHDE